MSDSRAATHPRSLPAGFPPRPVFVYSSEYNMDLGPHVFPAVKYGYIYLRLVDDPRFRKHRFVEPVSLTMDEVALVHERKYLDDLTGLKRTQRTDRSELPLTREIIDSFLISSGGTLSAAREALKNGAAINLGGGFHHAFAGHAEGFCYLNDVAIAVRTLQKEKLIRRALIVDLDLHQGNGTALAFQNDANVFTFSMHEENNYPIKEQSDMDIGLETGCRDEDYLTLLSRALETVKMKFKPDIIFYLAGVDVYEKDLLGGVKLSMNGIAERDRMVRDYLPEVPLVTVLAGGYAQDTDDTVTLHLQTCEILAEFS